VNTSFLEVLSNSKAMIYGGVWASQNILINNKHYYDIIL